MKNPWHNQAPKQNMSAFVPPGSSSEERTRTVRAPGELSGDPVLQEWQILEMRLIEEEKVILQKLADLSDRKGMPIIQENGQRRYGPPSDDSIPKPIRGSEVFVGKLPRDCYEPELVPVLEKAGKIYELRLMMNFSGNNRGYCFVQYSNPLEAERAVYELNNYEIRKGWRIGLARSVDNCRLFIGRLPKDKDADSIKKELNKLVEGVDQVVIRQPYNGGRKLGEKNRGFAFVEFNCHKAAAMARRRLILGKLKMWGQEVAVDWAEPEPEGKDLIVRGLSSKTSEKALHAYFDAVSHNGVVIVKKRFTDRAHVSFRSHYQALIAKAALEDKIIDGRKIQIEFDKVSCRQNEHIHIGRGCKVRVEFNRPKEGQPMHYVDNPVNESSLYPHPPPPAVCFNQKQQKSHASGVESMKEVRQGNVITAWNKCYDENQRHYGNYGGGEMIPNGFYYLPYTPTPAPPPPPPTYGGIGIDGGFRTPNFNDAIKTPPPGVQTAFQFQGNGFYYQQQQSHSAPWSPSNSVGSGSAHSPPPDCNRAQAPTFYDPFSSTFPTFAPCY